MFLSLDTVYRGQRNARRGVNLVYVTRGRSIERHLIPGPARTIADLLDITATTFDWGYPGYGPGLLALGLLLDFTQDRDLALDWFHQFKTDYVAGWTEPAWQISGAEIAAWLQSNGVKLTPAHIGRHAKE